MGVANAPNAVYLVGKQEGVSINLKTILSDFFCGFKRSYQGFILGLVVGKYAEIFFYFMDSPETIFYKYSRPGVARVAPTSAVCVYLGVCFSAPER